MTFAIFVQVTRASDRTKSGCRLAGQAMRVWDSRCGKKRCKQNQCICINNYHHQACAFTNTPQLINFIVNNHCETLKIILIKTLVLGVYTGSNTIPTVCTECKAPPYAKESYFETVLINKNNIYFLNAELKNIIKISCFLPSIH